MLDDYVRMLMEERATAVWVALLSDNSLVYMDDGRPGLFPASAWLRLARKLHRERLRICGLWLEFRSNSTRGHLPDHADGYYFCRQVVRTDSLAESLSFYLVGALTGDQLMVQRWKVPELILIDQSHRDPERGGDCLVTWRGRDRLLESTPGLQLFH